MGNSKYKKIKEISIDNIVCSYKVLNTEDNNVYIIKQILINNLKDEDLILIKNHISTMINIKDEYIIKYYDYFIFKEYLNIVTEYFEGINLRKLIKDYKERNEFIEKELIFKFIIFICYNLAIFHEKKLIISNLKPENIIFTNDHIFKIDFPLIKTNIKNNSKINDLYYIAPEILKGENYNESADIWSLGCIVQELCTLDYCFNSQSYNELLDKILNSNYSRININFYDKDLQQLIDDLLVVNNSERPNTINIVNQIFTKCDLFKEEESYKNYSFIQKFIYSSMGKGYITKENIYSNMKWSQIAVGGILGYASSILINGFIGLIPAYGLYCLYKYFMAPKLFKIKNKEDFIKDNLDISRSIQTELLSKICRLCDKNILKEEIIVYSKDYFEQQLLKIKERLLSEKF